MKNTIHVTPETTVSYHYKPERDELTVQLRPATGTLRTEPLPQWEHVQLQREQASNDIVGFTVSSVQQVLLEQLVRSLFGSLQSQFGDGTPQTEAVDSTSDATAESDLPTGVVAETWNVATDVAVTENETAPESDTTAQADVDANADTAPETTTDSGAISSTGMIASTATVFKTMESDLPPGVAVEVWNVATDTDVTSIEPASDNDTASQADTAPETTADSEVPVAVVAETWNVATDAEATALATTPENVEASGTAIEPETTPAPKSRSRNRRRGKGSAAAEVTEAEPQVEAVAELEAIVTSNEGDSDAAESPTTEDSGSSLVEAVAQQDSPTESAPKKSRSRRRGKGKAAEAEALADDTSVAQTAGATADDAPAENTVATDTADASDDTSVAEAAEPVATETPAPKSKSRRRKKAADPAPEVQPAVVAEEESAVEEIPTPIETPAAPPLYEIISEDDDEVEGESQSEQESTSAIEGGEAGKRKRRKRRKRHRNGGNGAEDANVVATESASSTPTPTPERAAPPAAPVMEASRNIGGSAYKSAPIEGLDAPDEFLFMGLNPLIGQALHALGYESPTGIQRRAVPEAMENRDIVGLAQTGTGKTLAFLLPSLHRMLSNTQGGHRPRLLVLTPTRELALQVATEAEYLATHTDFVIAAIYGQEDMKRQIRLLRDGVDVVVATPGRLLDHLNRGTIRLTSVETLVLDEADRMLDMGFLPDVRSILRRLSSNRQTMMFSATMPQAVQTLSLDFQREPVVIEVARQLPPSQIDQKIYPVERHLKIPLLEHLLKNNQGMRSVMIFTETKAEADIVHRKLTELGFNPALMHGDRTQRERERALEQLRNGTVRMLVATNVAARGLDIQDVTHVINYEVPQTVDDYVHRIGRTARGEGTEGTAITLATLSDNGMIARIESALERSLPRVYADDFNYDVPTPSWAKPSADDITATLTKPKNLAERFGRMMRRR